MMRFKRLCAALGAGLLIAIIMVGVLAGLNMGRSTVYADDYYSDRQYVYDYAEILSISEIEQLEEQCAKASKDCECDFVIVTTRIGHDYGTMDSYLENFLTSNGYAYDAIIYGIDMVSRADRIVTRGKAASDISQSKLDDIREKCEEEFTDGYYYDGLKYFIKRINRCLNTNIWVKLTYSMPIKIAISLGTAIVIISIMMYNAKARMTVSSTEYTKDHQFKVNDHRDIFINTTVVKRKIESSSGGGGGGGGGNSGSGGHF